ncbi:MAG: hypothetical protein JRH20_28850, partial [Deltaproteobacteria bacterium]|nr:hypothetical protein [Deltaproteobacteria bacterium]
PNKPKTVAPKTQKQVDQWLRKGPLKSREAFTHWLASPSFEQWYQGTLGTSYTGSRRVQEVPLATLQRIVEAAIPATRQMPTAYAALNGRAAGHPNVVSEQLAALLKTNKLEQGSTLFKGRAPLDMSKPAVSLYNYGQPMTDIGPPESW